jgi:hypothetical protein
MSARGAISGYSSCLDLLEGCADLDELIPDRFDTLSSSNWFTRITITPSIPWRLLGDYRRHTFLHKNRCQILPQSHQVCSFRKFVTEFHPTRTKFTSLIAFKTLWRAGSGILLRCWYQGLASCSRAQNLVLPSTSAMAVSTSRCYCCYCNIAIWLA